MAVRGKPLSESTARRVNQVARGVYAKYEGKLLRKETEPGIAMLQDLSHDARVPDALRRGIERKLAEFERHHPREMEREEINGEVEREYIAHLEAKMREEARKKT